MKIYSETNNTLLMTVPIDDKDYDQIQVSVRTNYYCMVKIHIFVSDDKIALIPGLVAYMRYICMVNDNCKYVIHCSNEARLTLEKYFNIDKHIIFICTQYIEFMCISHDIRRIYTFEEEINNIKCIEHREGYYTCEIM